MPDEMSPETYKRLNGIIKNSPKLLAIKNTSTEEMAYKLKKRYYIDRLKEKNFFQISLDMMMNNLNLDTKYEAQGSHRINISRPL